MNSDDIGDLPQPKYPPSNPLQKWTVVQAFERVADVLNRLPDNESRSRVLRSVAILLGLEDGPGR